MLNQDSAQTKIKFYSHSTSPTYTCPFFSKTIFNTFGVVSIAAPCPIKKIKLHKSELNCFMSQQNQNLIILNVLWIVVAGWQTFAKQNSFPFLGSFYFLFLFRSFIIFISGSEYFYYSFYNNTHNNTAVGNDPFHSFSYTYTVVNVVVSHTIRLQLQQLAQ